LNSIIDIAEFHFDLPQSPVDLVTVWMFRLQTCHDTSGFILVVFGDGDSNLYMSDHIIRIVEKRFFVIFHSLIMIFKNVSQKDIDPVVIWILHDQFSSLFYGNLILLTLYLHIFCSQVVRIDIQTFLTIFNTLVIAI